MRRAGRRSGVGSLGGLCTTRWGRHAAHSRSGRCRTRAGLALNRGRLARARGGQTLAGGAGGRRWRGSGPIWQRGGVDRGPRCAHGSTSDRARWPSSARRVKPQARDLAYTWRALAQRVIQRPAPATPYDSISPEFSVEARRPPPGQRASAAGNVVRAATRHARRTGPPVPVALFACSHEFGGGASRDLRRSPLATMPPHAVLSAQ